MYNLQGLIRRGINNTNVQFERLAYISNNIGNLNTTAYKDVRFEQTLDENGYLDGAVRYDYKVGATMRTKRLLDVALTGPGFIPVTSPNGDVKYTRDGSFKIDAVGQVCTSDGFLIQPQITIPQNATEINITPDGNVSVKIGNDNNQSLSLIHISEPTRH